MDTVSLTSAASEEQTILGFISAYLVAITIISVAVWVLLVIANWKILTKAGEKGWKSLIPVYSNYLVYKISWKPMYFWITAVLMVAGELITTLNTNKIVWLSIIAAILALAGAVIYIMDLHKLSKSFGHGAGFTVGLLFLPNIFTMILAFGKSEYKKLED